MGTTGGAGGTRRAATVVWELSQEGTVVVDVDAPVRPFGEVPHTPPRGTRVRDDLADPMDPAGDIVEREGKRRTLPPLPAR
jgi:hypothetical protein